MPHQQAGRAYAALALGVVAISWSAIFVRWTAMPGIASAFYRVLFAAIALTPLLLTSKRRLAAIRPRTLPLAALGGVFFAGDLGFYNVAVLHTSAGGATFLGNNAPLVVGLITWAITRRLPSHRFWIALAVGTLGAYCIVAPDLRRSGLASTADGLAIAASVCFALYLVTTERLRSTFDSIALITLSSAASAVALLLLAFLTHTSLRIPATASLLALLGLALVCQIAGYLSLTYALGHLPATVTSIVMLLVAPFTAILAFYLFHEQLTRLQLAGGLFVLLGVWIVSSASRTRTEQAVLTTPAS